MEFQLHDLPTLHRQKVLITGAAGRLGQQLATLFAARGAMVAVHARDAQTAANTVQKVRAAAARLCAGADPLQNLETPAAKQQTVDEPLIVPVVADLCAPQAAAALLEAAQTKLHGLSGIINCAAAQPVIDFAELAPEKWRELLEINLSVAHEITRSAAQILPRGSWITHISSIEAERPAKGHSYYAVSKAALNMHAKAAALELGAQGIRVNALAPGLLEREGIREDWPQGVKSWEDHAPLGRLVTGFEVAAACAMLASPAMGAVTGQVLAVDCGMLATPGW